MLSALFAEQIGDFSKIESITAGSTLSIGPNSAELSIKQPNGSLSMYTVSFVEEAAAKDTKQEGETRLRIEAVGGIQDVREEVGYVADLKNFLEDQMALRSLLGLSSDPADPESARAMLTTSLPVPAEGVAKNMYPGYYFGRLAYGNVNPKDSDESVLATPGWKNGADLRIGIHPSTGEIIILDQNYKKIGTCTNINALPRLLKNIQPTVSENYQETPLAGLLSDAANRTTMVVSQNVSWPHFDLEAYIVNVGGNQPFYVAASGKGAETKYKLCKDNFQGEVVQNWTPDKQKIIDDLSRAA
ncbi:MAG: hypothetical protein WCT46_02530 [Candidatus Gracilibacteria bacterium]|jgi:hypothetical protein